MAQISNFSKPISEEYRQPEKYEIQQRLGSLLAAEKGQHNSYKRELLERSFKELQFVQEQTKKLESITNDDYY